MPAIHGKHQHARETFNVISHLAGSVLAAIGTVALVLRPLSQGEHGKALALAFFGLSLVLMYTVSTLFHITRGEARLWLRRLDRAAIYVLIVGAYTPLCLFTLPETWGWPLLMVTGTLALVGVVLELRVASHRTLHSVGLYLVLGWMATLAIKPLLTAIDIAGVALLLAGGVLYTAGAIALRYRLVPRSHEVWHVVVLAASACHFLMMFLYVS